MSTLEQRRKTLSSQIASFGVAPKKVKKVYSKPATIYKSATKLPWIPAKPEKKQAPIRSPFGVAKIIKGDDGRTPKKGIDYMTPNEMEAIKREIASTIPVQEPIEVNDEMVKKIIQIMHSLPETDKLEVSKGIRNAQSFIYGGTKYKTEELMHGGSSSTTTTLVNNELVAGSGTTFTLANTPTLGSEQVYARGQRIFPGVTGYSITGKIITTVDTFVAGDIYATYTK